MIELSRRWSTDVRQAGMGITKGCVHQPAAQFGHVLHDKRSTSVINAIAFRRMGVRAVTVLAVKSHDSMSGYLLYVGGSKHPLLAHVHLQAVKMVTASSDARDAAAEAHSPGGERGASPSWAEGLTGGQAHKFLSILKNLLHLRAQQAHKADNIGVSRCIAGDLQSELAALQPAPHASQAGP
ncbi:MAG: hypothetical protein FRX49_12725 [Trebouxia sp. A1-2]|nr:MAG: hypothetical protein FRX49_12725 [Trebouxia sp. A1-2]